MVGKSGVTYGRGLDIGSLSSAKVRERFAKMAEYAEPLSERMLAWLEGGAGLQEQRAYVYLKTLADQVPPAEQVLSRKQQHFLFLLIYSGFETETKRILTKPAVRNRYGALNWENLPIKVKEVLIDLTYRGDNKPSTREWFMPALMQDQERRAVGKQSAFYVVMENERWKNIYKVPPDRYDARLRRLK